MTLSPDCGVPYIKSELRTKKRTSSQLPGSCQKAPECFFFLFFFVAAAVNMEEKKTCVRFYPRQAQSSRDAIDARGRQEEEKKRKTASGRSAVAANGSIA